MIRSRLRIVFLGLACLLAAPRGQAHPDLAAGRASVVGVVRIVITGDTRTTRALGELVQELVSELPVELEWTESRSIDPREAIASRTGDRHALVRAWVDLSDSKRARLYVANEDSDRFIVRFVPEPNGYDAVAREALGQILESSIAAFVAGEEAGMSREDALREVAKEAPAVVEAPEPRAAEPAPRRPPPRVTLGVAYQQTALGGGVFQHGGAVLPGISLGGGDTRFASRAIVAYRAPARWDGDEIGVSLSGGAFRVAAGIDSKVTRNLTLSALFGGGADVVFVEPLARTPGVRAGASSRVVEAIVLAMGTADLRLGAGLGVFLGFGYELDVAYPRYGIADSAGATPVWTPSVARATGLIGFVVDFGGSEPRPARSQHDE